MTCCAIKDNDKDTDREYEFANYGDGSKCLCTGGSRPNREAVWRRWWAKQKKHKAED